MDQEKRLYLSSYNPLLIKPARPLPKEIAVIGAGTIGPDIGYYLKSALPDIKLHLIDVVEEALSRAEERILAIIDVKNHDNGLLTPKAHLHRKITVDDVLKARIISWPFTLYDACGMSDGGAAAIVTTPEIAKSMRKDYILVKSQGVATGSGQSTLQSEFDFLRFPENVAAAKAAYEEAGITNPREEISMAELHDCFSSTELITIEDLGFSERGKAPEDIKAGRYLLKGEQPINTDGGLKCFGHPLSASGLRMTYEVYKQLQGKVDNPERQLKNPKLGLVHNLGGNVGIHVSAVSILGLP